MLRVACNNLRYKRLNRISEQAVTSFLDGSSRKQATPPYNGTDC
jgi:hypothetical protein